MSDNAYTPSFIDSKMTILEQLMAIRKFIVENHLEEFTEVIADIEANIETLFTRVGNNETSIETINADLVIIKNQIVQLQQDLISKGVEITNLSGRVDTNNQAITELQQTVNTINSTLNSIVTTTIPTMQGQIDYNYNNKVDKSDESFILYGRDNLDEKTFPINLNSQPTGYSIPRYNHNGSLNVLSDELNTNSAVNLTQLNSKIAGVSGYFPDDKYLIKGLAGGHYIYASAVLMKCTHNADELLEVIPIEYKTLNGQLYAIGDRVTIENIDGVFRFVRWYFAAPIYPQIPTISFDTAIMQTLKLNVTGSEAGSIVITGQVLDTTFEIMGVYR